MLVSCHTLWHSTYSGDFVGSCVCTDMYMFQLGTVCAHESKICHVLEWVHVHMFNMCACACACACVFVHVLFIVSLICLQYSVQLDYSGHTKD